jgi:hypothetical protein
MNQSIDEKRLAELIAQIPTGASDDVIYAGLAILARDMYYYLEETNQLKQAPLLVDAVRAVKEEEEKTFGLDKAYPEYRNPPEEKIKLSVSKLPSGLTQKATTGELDVQLLIDPNIDHEWFSSPGRKLLDKITDYLRDTICDEPYRLLSSRKFNNQLTAAVSSVIITGVATGTMVPAAAAFGVYCGVALSRKGLKGICQSP